MCDLIEVPIRKRLFCTGVGSIAVGEPVDEDDFNRRMGDLLEVIAEVKTEANNGHTRR